MLNTSSSCANRMVFSMVCASRPAAKDESAVDDYAGLVTGLGETAHFVHGDAFLDPREDVARCRFRSRPGTGADRSP
jgi:hypothetical protein